jgi:prepilin-type N-terminal cleavage/methylation domain-containing protein
MKKGITLIEMLITISIISVFIVVCYPHIKTLSNNINEINVEQKNTNQSVILINVIYTYFNNEIINVDIVNDSIYTKEHILIIDENKKIFIDGKDLNIYCKELIVKKNYLIFKIYYEEYIESILIRGNIVENNSS